MPEENHYYKTIILSFGDVFGEEKGIGLINDQCLQKCSLVILLTNQLPEIILIFLIIQTGLINN